MSTEHLVKVTVTTAPKQPWWKRIWFSPWLWLVVDVVFLVDMIFFSPPGPWRTEGLVVWGILLGIWLERLYQEHIWKQFWGI